MFIFEIQHIHCTIINYINHNTFEKKGTHFGRTHIHYAIDNMLSVTNISNVNSFISNH